MVQSLCWPHILWCIACSFGRQSQVEAQAACRNSYAGHVVVDCMQVWQTVTSGSSSSLQALIVRTCCGELHATLTDSHKWKPQRHGLCSSSLQALTASGILSSCSCSASWSCHCLACSCRAAYTSIMHQTADHMTL